MGMDVTFQSHQECTLSCRGQRGTGESGLSPSLPSLLSSSSGSLWARPDLPSHHCQHACASPWQQRVVWAQGSERAEGPGEKVSVRSPARRQQGSPSGLVSPRGSLICSWVGSAPKPPRVLGFLSALFLSGGMLLWWGACEARTDSRAGEIGLSASLFSLQQ